MNPPSDEVRRILRPLVTQEGVLGWLLVQRDGVCVRNECKALPSADTFSAMSAAVLGAAEMALGELGDLGTPRVVAQGKQNRLIAGAAADDLLLVVVLGPDANLSPVLDAFGAAVTEFAKGAAQT